MTTIFNQDNGETTPESKTQNFDATAETMLKSIVNERGEPKYATVEDALKALQHSQSFIGTLKNEKTEVEQRLAEYEARIQQMDSLKEAVERLSQKQPQTEQPFDESRLQELVTQTLTKRQQEEQRAKNLETIRDAALNRFGDKAGEVFYQKAKELGFDPDQVNELAASNPTAVMKMFDLEQPTHKQRVHQPSIRSEAFRHSQTESAIGFEKERLGIGATTSDFQDRMERAKKMTEELEAMGLSAYDLTNPAVAKQYGIKF